jgi:amino acid transporter
MLNFAGFTAASYYAGEVKQVKKTQVYALFGATIAFGLLLAVFFGILYSVIGAPFLHSLDFLSISGNPAYTLPVPPEGQSLIIFATGNPIMLVLAPMILIVSFFAGTIASNFLASRMIFAWSFDRLTPTKLLDLDSRFGAPYWTYILIGVIGLISVFISVYTTLFNYLAYEATGFAIVYMVAGLAALVFPFRRKELFQGSPDIVKKRIGGVPLISILGLLTFVVSAIIAYATLTPAFQGGPLNFQNVLVVGAITVLGVAFYYISYFYNKQRGIDLNLTFKEIPPE